MSIRRTAHKRAIYSIAAEAPLIRNNQDSIRPCYPCPCREGCSPEAQLQSGKAVAMPDARELEREAVEDHRFFPEWADRPPSTESLHEADRNSYLAGGYAEEFGHGVQQTNPAHTPPAEEDREWRVQIGGLHPGYPECPRPRDRDLRGKPSDAAAPLRAGSRAVDALHRSLAAFKVIVVGRNSGSKRHYGAILAALARLSKALWIRRHKLPLS